MEEEEKGTYIHLFDNYYIRGTKWCWKLSFKNPNLTKEGHQFHRDQGFYVDVKVLLKDLLQRAIRVENNKTFDELIEYSMGMKAKINRAIDVVSEIEKEIDDG